MVAYLILSCLTLTCPSFSSSAMECGISPAYTESVVRIHFLLFPAVGRLLGLIRRHLISRMGPGLYLTLCTRFARSMSQARVSPDYDFCVISSARNGGDGINWGDTDRALSPAPCN
ncbi:hypothetical protein V8C44DRAFT_318292 [Trichoderma aethiopicum]